MPTYVYRCRECGESLEVFQSFSDKPLKTHEGCGGALQKVFHASGVVFKGSGYYVTDSRPSRSGAPANSKPSDGSTDTSADKPAKKNSDGNKSSKSEKSSSDSSGSKSAAAAD